VYIKGYKVDEEKIEQQFGTHEDDPDNTSFIPIWQTFPYPFLCVAGGMEPDGDVSVVVVLAEGLNKEELEQQPMVTLGEPYTRVFTPGIWFHW
jgi:hypothetical protein